MYFSKSVGIGNYWRNGWGLPKLENKVTGSESTTVSEKKLTLLHSKRPKLYAILVFLNAIGLKCAT